MFDWQKIEQYRESNVLEAKKAAGGLPASIWETYSAFANTIGGYIVLGVEEQPCGVLRPIRLADPDALIAQFWNTVNNRQKVSVNILTASDVTLHEVDGGTVIVIRVPRARRSDKPVYIDGDMFRGSYRRDGSGDYHCSEAQVRAMIRDGAESGIDAQVLREVGREAIDSGSVRKYRNRMNTLRPAHVWAELDETEFLYRLGAIGRGEDGELHPTGAGLLMFGQEHEITQVFARYFLDYRRSGVGEMRWEDRLISSAGDWSGNLYDFYFRVFEKIEQLLPVAFRMRGGVRVDDSPLHVAVREALANCLINADYAAADGVVVTADTNGILFSNPGLFRIDIEAALSGGLSDPRNVVLMKMFNLIGIGERAGSGIPSVAKIWEEAGLGEPVWNETYTPERSSLYLPLRPLKASDKTNFASDKTTEASDKLCGVSDLSLETSDKSSGARSESENNSVNDSGRTAEQWKIIIDFLHHHDECKTADIAQLLGVSAPRARALLAGLAAEGILQPLGKNRNRRYILHN